MISYKLEFQNANNERIDKGIFNSISEAKKEMFRLIKEMGFECYYTREAKRENYLWIDFGSHYEFFRIYSLDISPVVGISVGGENIQKDLITVDLYPNTDLECKRYCN